MRHILTALIFATTLALAGCAHKPGLGSWLDAGATYAALSSGGFVEANPLLDWGPSPAATALATIGLKHGVKYALEHGLDIPHLTAHRAVETGGMLAAGWNLALLAGASGLVPLVGGFGAALWYWVWSGE